MFGGNGLTRSDVSLTNGAGVFVRANQTLETFNTAFSGNTSSSGSTININANNVRIVNDQSTSNVNQSFLDAGLNKDTGTKTVPGGNIQIDTPGKLSISDISFVANRTLSQDKDYGNSQKIKINAREFELTKNSQINSSTSGNGNAGNIEITTTDSLKMSDNVQISVNSEKGKGTAGAIILSTNRLNLNNSVISATANSLKGGDITLYVSEKLLLRNTSRLTTTSGSSQVGGNGGDIRIIAPNGFLVSAPQENNDIEANAFSGSGGKVTIDTKQNFWISPLSRTELEKRLGTTNTNQLDPFNLQTNDITAISQVNPNLSGQITITPPEIDITAGLSPLPNNLTDPTNQINPNCSPKAIGNNSFTSIGRGGIPRTPFAPLNEEQITSSWVKLNPQDNQPSTPVATLPAQPKPIVEAQGWRRDSNGDILLVVQSSSDTSFPQPQPASGCVAR